MLKYAHHSDIWKKYPSEANTGTMEHQEDFLQKRHIYICTNSRFFYGSDIDSTLAGIIPILIYGWMHFNKDSNSKQGEPPQT